MEIRVKMKKNITSLNYLKKIKKRRSFVCGLKNHKLSFEEIKFLKIYKPWGVILFKRNILNIKQTQKLTRHIKKIFNDKFYPILIDEEGGRVSRVNNIFDNSSFNSGYFGKLFKQNKQKFFVYYDIYIKQILNLLKLLGINFNTIPVLDLNLKNSHKIISDRSFSNNPKIVSEIGDFVIKKLHENKCISIIKHIPGHGRAKSDSHLTLPVVGKSLNFLKKNDFLPFKNKKSLLAMTAHILYKKIDNKYCATHSHKIIQIIRRDIGFKNLIITDDISMKALKYSLSLNTKLAFSAGCDLVLHCNGDLKQMKKVAKNSPLLSEFVIKKTSQIIKKLS